jgi:hypothetical protein
VLLINLRNEIMHAKPASDGAHGGTQIAATLERRDIAQPLFPDVPMAWFHKLESPGVGVWACKSALGIIRAVLDLSPAPEFPDPDPLTMLRKFHEPFLDRFEPREPSQS